MERTLTIRQPWAWAIFEAGKNIENRTWVPSYRGRLWIHTSKQLRIKGQSLQAQENRRAIGTIKEISGKNFYDSSSKVATATGAIIGWVNVVEVFAPAYSEENPWHMDGQWGWYLEDPVLLETPITCRGQLGLWDCSGYL